MRETAILWYNPILGERIDGSFFRVNTVEARNSEKGIVFLDFVIILKMCGL
jgi:hypothetical protein